ncbi:MAG: hypothetical protein DPW09_31360 [Anaerolineae bacterium]|nr:hypothetical protein [Anaerolineae bacterium]
MTAKWLALRSLRRNQQLLKAINVLSLHLQLIIEGHESDVQPPVLAAARTKLLEFLDRLEAGIHQAKESEIGVIYGADARFQAFVESYIDAQKNASTSLLANDLASIRRFLDSDAANDQESLLAYLTHLRVLVEEQINHDTVQAL